MNFEYLLLMAIAVLGLLIVIGWVAKHYFSEGSRQERRRRRSNSRIQYKQHKPSVRFSVRTRKSK